MIANELSERAKTIYTFLETILKKPDDNEESLKLRIGIATSVLMNLCNRELNIYATKLGIMLIASGNIY